MTDKKNTTLLDTLAKGVDKATRVRYEEQKEQGIVNPIVLAALLGIRPQMIYNYIAKGKLTDKSEAIDKNSTQKKTIDIVEANTWANSYLAKKVEREEKAKAEIEADLAGETANA